MSTPEHDRLTRLFLEALALPSQERDAFLDRVCEDDQDLRQELESLLRHHAAAPAILDSEGIVAVSADDLLPPPTSVGPYAILRKLGEGGMGVVYLAEQQRPIQRTVALKLIKPGYETRQVLARFETERTVLSRLEHASIARVLDAGVTEAGRPYFAMEYVRGEPITSYCDRKRLNLTARLELFLAVCDAVHYAHQNSIIHRDIKPTNVLVAEVDGRPAPKIIDFGIAKALADHRQLAFTLTEVGQFVGTPEYMSPEQATTGSGMIDTRSDVYSLGALLYELLAGNPPFGRHLRDATEMDEVRRIIREDDPLRPSECIAQHARTLPQLARARDSDASGLMRGVRGDLDSIVEKALRRERSKRYGSVSDLAADLRRHLRHDPIEARPAGTLYRLGRFARKHRPAVVLAAVLLPVLLGVAVTMLLQADRVRRERDRAEEVSEFLVNFWDIPFFVPGRHYPPDPADVLTLSLKQVERHLVDRPELQARMIHTMGKTLGGVGDLESACPVLEESAARLAELLGTEHERTLAARNDLARTYRGLGRSEEAERLFVEVLSARERKLGRDHLDTLRTRNDLALQYKISRRTAESAALYEQTLPAMNAALGEDAPEALTTASLLASVYLELDRLDEAAAVLEPALALMQPDLLERPIALNALARIYSQQGRRDDAMHYLRRSMEEGFGIWLFTDPHLEPLFADPEFIEMARRAALRDPYFHGDLILKARSMADDGRVEEAVQLLEYLSSATPADSPAKPLHPRFALSNVYQENGYPEKAEEEILRIIDVMRRDHGPEYIDIGTSLWHLAQSRILQGQRQGAVDALEEARQLFRRTGVAHWAAYVDADLSALAGDPGAAARHFTAATQHGFNHPHILERDEILRPILGDPRFEKALQTFRRRHVYP